MSNPTSRSWIADYVNEPTIGPLPASLLVLTIATGIVVAVSILSLGRVFVANMTGHRGRLLLSATSVEVVLLLVAAITLAAVPEPYSGATRDAVAAGESAC